jgi:hypothetical protein
MQEYDRFTTDELDAASTTFQVATLNVGAILLGICDGDTERANREIRLALDLPPSVIARRAAAAESVANANGIPDRAQLAALIARLMGTVSSIQAVIERRSSSTLQ